MQQLSAQDAQFLYMETNKSLSHVTAVGIFDPSTAPEGTVRFKEIIQHVRGRLHTSPIYRRRIHHVPMELDYPYWVEDEHFDIEYHISHSRLPMPSDWRQLCINLARFHSRPLDMQRAPWEMLIIEGLDHVAGIPKGCYAVTTKIHHAAADGMTMVKFFNALYDIDAEGTPAVQETPKITSARYEKPSLAQMSVRGLISAARSPFKIANTLMNNAPSLTKAAQRQFLQRENEPKEIVPHTRFNLETSPHRMFDATHFELEDFKKIRQLVAGATINDVVLNIASGALRRYLISHKELPTDSLRAFAPVNTRRARKDGDKAKEPGNSITTISPTLFTNIEDPVERLQKIQEETSKQKSANKGLTARLMTDVTRHMPASAQLLTARLLTSSEAAGRLTNVCISNVPGPSEPVYMNGARCLKNMGLGPLGDRMGLFIAVTSYNAMMSFNATSCRRTMPDIEFFTECLRVCFDELLEAAKNFEEHSVTSKKTTKKAKQAKKTRRKSVAYKLPQNRKKRAKKSAAA